MRSWLDALGMVSAYHRNQLAEVEKEKEKEKEEYEKSPNVGRLPRSASAEKKKNLQL